VLNRYFHRHHHHHHQRRSLFSAELRLSRHRRRRDTAGVVFVHSIDAFSCFDCGIDGPDEVYIYDQNLSSLQTECMGRMN
jgi:hypothetical protein